MAGTEVVAVELIAYGGGDVNGYAVALQLDVNDSKLLASPSSYPSGLLSCMDRQPSQQSEQLSFAPMELLLDQARICGSQYWPVLDCIQKKKKEEMVTMLTCPFCKTNCRYRCRCRQSR